jgi:uncharacterized protein YdhG (YjbR/CyaY superfamily)
MRKANPRDAGAAAKGDAAPKTVDEYLAAVAEPARGTLNSVRATIRSAVPPGTTEGISYRIPTFKYKGPLIGFAAFSTHCSLFVMSGSVLEGFQGELKNYPTSKGTVRFPIDKPLPAVLVRKLVKARVAQNDKKKAR